MSGCCLTSCTVNDDYIPYILDCFFHAQGKVREQYIELTAEQEQPKKTRRPVGFATSEE